ncbi:serine/threonine protein kinase [Allocatelliglobosispora scoriae]|uniref:non-specific serine/threonine protein kinase n=1 Tax=Allocatelliglobosispora scoriae TaxID=643052 RepID=A0A841BWY6_9ACTN|nr:serine/threonine protein kinase [Allocatelliglobosispora scoriae]
MNNPQSADLPPTIAGLGELKLHSHGGYATIYRATQGRVGREVAVKIENRTIEDELEQRRFIREAHAAGRMSSHRHVVDLFDAGVTDDNRPFLVMELCAESYADRMKVGVLDQVEVRELGVKIAGALADAHKLGVLHRDVKPANILISVFGEPALADFGLSILVEMRDPTVNLEILTPAYAPPEMFDRAEPAPAADVYSLCATLYALLRGAPPRWRDDHYLGLSALLELFTEAIPDLAGVSPQLTELLRQGMSNDPLDRPTAAELAGRLAALELTSEIPGQRGAPSLDRRSDAADEVTAPAPRRWSLARLFGLDD